MGTKFKNKKVLIFGLGLNQGGVGSAQFFAENGAVVKVTDLKKQEILKPSLVQLNKHNISYSLGEHKHEDIDWADLIIRNPAIKDTNPYLKYALKKGKKVESDFSVFLDFADQKRLIAITGTKGKSTTASLIYEAIKASGQKVIFAGNIGKSILDTLPFLSEDPWIIVEISSFQLQALKDKNFAPHIAVITNIYPDHLNWHATLEEYILAKQLIAKNQIKEDFLFIRKGDEVVDQPSFLSNLQANIIHFSKTDLPRGFKPKLLGSHNLENIAAAYQVGKALKINSNHLLKTLEDFRGIPFRMELVKHWGGFKIYNDTTSTMPSATIQSLQVFGPRKEKEESKIILICGGMNKKLSYKELAYAIDRNAKAVYFIEGDAVDSIICEMTEKPIIEGRFSNLEQLLLKIKGDIATNSYYKEGDIILFSPGATSFNLFQNEFDRGRKFNNAVKKVFV